MSERTSRSQRPAASGRTRTISAKKNLLCRSAPGMMLTHFLGTLSLVILPALLISRLINALFGIRGKGVVTVFLWVGVVMALLCLIYVLARGFVRIVVSDREIVLHRPFRQPVSLRHGSFTFTARAQPFGRMPLCWLLIATCGAETLFLRIPNISIEEFNKILATLRRHATKREFREISSQVPRETISQFYRKNHTTMKICLYIASFCLCLSLLFFYLAGTLWNFSSALIAIGMIFMVVGMKIETKKIKKALKRIPKTIRLADDHFAIDSFCVPFSRIHRIEITAASRELLKL